MSGLSVVALTILNWIDSDRSSVHRHTQTYVERKQFLGHSLLSLDGDNN